MQKNELEMKRKDARPHRMPKFSAFASSEEIGLIARVAVSEVANDVCHSMNSVGVATEELNGRHKNEFKFGEKSSADTLALCSCLALPLIEILKRWEISSNGSRGKSSTQVIN